jgi:hypothetical protein
VPQNVNN